MPDKLPIDYARAESADVVRKKFRRRVVMFVIATVVLMVIGIGWAASHFGPTWLIGSARLDRAVSVWLGDGAIVFLGSKRTTPLVANWKYYRLGSYEIGVTVYRWKHVGMQKWTLEVRYRTLFILTMIPWIITLIRMIRMWKRRPGL